MLILASCNDGASPLVIMGIMIGFLLYFVGGIVYEVVQYRRSIKK